MRYIFIILSFCLTQGYSTTIEEHLKSQLDLAYTLEASKPDSALVIYKSIIKESRKANLPLYTFKATQYSGIVFSDNGRYDSAQVYYEKALEISKTSGNRTGEGAVYINLGNVFLFRSLYPEAIESYHSGIRIYEVEKDTNKLSIAYRNLSGLYRELEDYTHYEEYLNKSIDITRDSVSLGYLYNDRIKYFIDKEKLKKAKEALNRTLQFVKTSKNKRVLFFTHRNQGEYYRAIYKPNKAVEYYLKALKDLEYFKDLYFEMDLYKVLSYTYIDLKDTQKAKLYILKTQSIAEQLKAQEVIAKSYEVLAEIDFIENPSKAYTFLQKGKAINDSIKQTEYYNKIAELEEEFQSQKKDIALANQKVELEQLENKALKSENQLYLSILIGGLFVLISLTSIWFYKREQRLKKKEIYRLQLEKEKEKLEALITGEEQERKRLAKDLHDGINGDLSALKFKLLAFESSNFTNEQHKGYQVFIDMLDQSCALIRHISHNLAPPSIRDFGLLESVKQFCSKLNVFEEAHIEFYTYGDQVRFSELIETNIYRIVQELVLNAIKHSEAKEIFVQLNFTDKNLNITVEDDGKGFNKDENFKGIGLKNIHSRVEFLNGGMEISSNNEGTSVLISLFINNLEQHD